MSQSSITKKSYGASIKGVTKKKIKIDEEQIEEFKEAFNLFDTTHSGEIDSREFKAALKALGYEVKKDDVIAMFNEVSKEITAKISYDDFLKIMTPRIKDRSSREEIMKIFKLFDEDNTNKISLKNLKKVAQEIGENISDDELKEMMQEADKDKDGFIGAEDFYRVMRKKYIDPLEDLSDDD